MNGSSWTPINLQPYLREDAPEDKPTYLSRTDQAALLYARHLHFLSGEPEGMKSWLAQIAIAERLKATDHPNIALYIDFESDCRPIVSRFRALGVTNERITKGLIYIRPEERFDEASQHALTDLAFKPEISLFDGVAAGMGLCGKNPNAAEDFTYWWGMLGRPIQLTTSGPTVLIDHVAKDPLNRGQHGQYMAGTYAKLAAADVHIGVDVITPFGRGLTGRARLIVHKDRPGWLRGQAVGGRALAELVLTSDLDSGAVTYALEPSVAAGAEGFRPTVLMERISQFLEPMTEPLSGYAIVNAIPGKKAGKLTALKVLAAEGYLQCSPGPRDGLLYRSQKPFHLTGSPPVPIGSQEPVTTDRFSDPPLTGVVRTGTGQSGNQNASTGSPPVAGQNGRSRCPLGHHCSQPPSGRVICCGNPVSTRTEATA